MAAEKTKRCLKCESIKAVSMFSRDKSQKDGYSLYCKECRALYVKVYQKENKEKINARQRKYYNNNIEKQRERSRRYYKNNMGEISLRAKDRYNKNPQKYIEWTKKYHRKKPNIKTEYLQRDRKNLGDRYVKDILARAGVKYPAPWLIDLKRQQLFATRKLKNNQKEVLL